MGTSAWVVFLSHCVRAPSALALFGLTGVPAHRRRN